MGDDWNPLANLIPWISGIRRGCRRQRVEQGEGELAITRIIVGAGEAREISHFCLAKVGRILSLPVPCQESEEKQKHGKPLPSVSKSLGQGKFFVGNKGLATCCKARTANASVVLGNLLSSPMLTLETSGRIFLFPIAKKLVSNDIRPRPRFGRPLHSLIPRGRQEQSRLWKEMKSTVCSN
jgi:hypothetical protein